MYVVADTAKTFRKSDTAHLTEVIQDALANPQQLQANAVKAKQRAQDQFSWEAVTRMHEKIFFG